MRRLALLSLCLVIVAAIAIALHPLSAAAQGARGAQAAASRNASTTACLTSPNGNDCLKERLDGIDKRLEQIQASITGLQPSPSSAASGPPIGRVKDTSGKGDEQATIKYLQARIDAIQVVVNQLVDRANQR